ncbi:carbohydrate ABC transporter substrate-binding protein (CUT1 family) [Halanaerobium saccharolyticum]|uniref:Carbohydrate ABC transporter substrate-binding protein (CUT1 family) n=1 Tax=Halanaerobium saccharolyticum TaxID=43595 RepID=A0A4R7Z984_9FIRM|nr:extracellular solute-binding protein [Halanaerobium saccharolyticum]RAK09420.1 carbohydrate ABC transporter substrate-binding protein (CUT1 family) [Halanaerobium saccharolyticum]TDW06277.1 carbohydrate ABC transporter substrate-binding protein (CUT1 family) [Halanaerobium saccharolyticum]TDX61071.1 carbohydrate ABC transporter substrate-binding protein (CUT1 family) [Halanaerobium saccharolyticum]
MSKKILLIFLLTILFFSAAVQAEKEIEFWTINLSPQFDDYFLKKIEEFENENPEIKINWEDINFSSINQQLRYRIAEGNIPEVVNLSPQLMASLLEEELLFPISSLEKDFSQYYYPLFWENGYYKGDFFAFPWYVSSKLMAFNQEIFKIAGVNPQNIPKSREEFFNLAEKITAATGVYAIMPQIKIQHEFIEAGIKLFENEDQRNKAAFNTEKAEAIIKRYQNLAEKGVIPKDTLSSGFNIALERYKKNDLAILLTAPQFLKEIGNESDYLKDVTALSIIPTAEEGVINAALMNLVIPKGASHKTEAAEFAHFITSAEAQAEFSDRASVLPSAVISEKENNIEKKDIITKTDQTKSLETEAQKILRSQLSRNKDLTLIHPQADRLIRVMDEQFARAFAGKISASEALNIMEEKWNQILAEEINND